LQRIKFDEKTSLEMTIRPDKCAMAGDVKNLPSFQKTSTS